MSEDVTTPAAPARDVDPRLLEMLVCPASKGALVYDRAAQELVCAQSQLAYPIRDGIPIMLPDEARSLSDDEVLRYRRK